MTNEKCSLPPTPVPALPRARRLADLCRGKTVAVVGSATPERDMSAEIDACDVVIRMNNFYNMKSGRVGRKTDVVVLTPCAAWHRLSGEEKGEAVIRGQKPLIFSIRYPERLMEPRVRSFFQGCEFARDDAASPSVNRFTTGTVALSRIAEFAENCRVLTVGYSPREEFLAYLERDGRHYLPHARIEACARDKYLEVCAAKKLLSPIGETPVRVLIPARKGSSLKDKNVRTWRNGKPLLAVAVETAREAFGAPPVVLTDSEDYAALARAAGAEVPYLDPDTDGDEDVVVKLRRWRDVSGFYGQIIVQQCTTPTTSAETLRRVRGEGLSLGLRAGTGVLTAVADAHKASAYFAWDGKTKEARHLMRGVSPSVPRQKIPGAWRFTGAAALVHTDALDAPALFDGMEFRLVPVPEREAVDIDKEDDFNG